MREDAGITKMKIFGEDYELTGKLSRRRVKIYIKLAKSVKMPVNIIVEGLKKRKYIK